MKPGHSHQVFSMCKHVLSSYFTAELSQTRTSYKILIQSLWQATSSSKLIAPILSLQMAKVLPSKTQNMGKFLSMVTSSSVEPQAFFHLLGKIYSKFWKDKNKNKKHTHITSGRYIQLIEIIHPTTSKNISYPKMHCLEQFAIQWWNDLRWPRFYITLLCKLFPKLMLFPQPIRSKIKNNHALISSHHSGSLLVSTHPSISMHNLHADFYIFPKVLITRIYLTIKSLFGWWSFPFFSWL